MGQGKGPEDLEPHRKPVAIGPVPLARRQVQPPAVQALERLEHRAVVLRSQPLGDMHPVVGIDPDQVSVEGSVMDLGERDAVGNDRLAERLVAVGDDVGGVEQHRLGQPESAQRPW